MKVGSEGWDNESWDNGGAICLGYSAATKNGIQVAPKGHHSSRDLRPWHRPIAKAVVRRSTLRLFGITVSVSARLADRLTSAFAEAVWQKQQRRLLRHSYDRF